MSQANLDYYQCKWTNECQNSKCFWKQRDSYGLEPFPMWRDENGEYPAMKKNERRVIAVASGFETKNFRSSESLKLLNWGFRNTNTFEISKKNKQSSFNQYETNLCEEE